MASKHQETIDSLWIKYQIALQRLDKALDELEKKPKEVVVEKIVEVPVEVEKIVEVAVEVEKVVEKEVSKPEYFRLMREDELGLQADNASKNPSKTGFGIKFPDNPNKGDMFLRVDSKPTKLFKYDGNKWFEVDKDKTDTYTYDEDYLKHLIERINRGDYTLEELTITEQEELKRFLKKETVLGK
jgi:hypothetical protein